MDPSFPSGVGLLVNCAQGNVMRLLPALNVTEEELRAGFRILGRCWQD